MSQRSSVKGFTLIEMLIAISLLGIMVVLLFASLRIAAESWNSGEAKISEVNKKAVVYQFFKRHLSNTKPFPIIQENQAQNAQQLGSQELPKLAFEGLPQSISFVSALPAASARKGLQVFHVGLDPQQPSTLKVALTPYRQTESIPADAEPVVLLENLRHFKISYFGASADNVDGNGAWLDEWQGQATGQLPKLVKVSIALNDDSFWPDMIFALKINGQPNAEALLGEQNQQPGIANE
ncbi:prepilin-type N-terminal cleavage/methylation domain-containing protein [Methylomonas sp. Kb3]|uniref:prepilin-type N-terminal cleavage/methylation domain-containing protein n=1 Tax=unclassified Methylomonas TaxID=2608980 RepID=UPI0013FE4BEC|nr:prepilin-type N-terminal cleavage/methylation domain-containing protein [Methylomonas sp. Kb3]